MGTSVADAAAGAAGRVPLKVLLLIVTVVNARPSALLEIPPPVLAELPFRVLLLIVSVSVALKPKASMLMPPPEPPVELPLRVLLLISSVSLPSVPAL